MMYMLGLISSCTSPFLQTYPKMALSPPDRGTNFLKSVTKICELCQGDPDWGRKMFSTPIGDSIRFSGKNENQSISVINNFLSRSFKKNLNGKKLDLYILKGLDQ